MGRDWSGWGGFRSGSCRGVHQEPFEKSPTGTELMLDGMVRMSATIKEHLDQGPPTQLPCPHTYTRRGEVGPMITKESPSWDKAVNKWEYPIKKTLQALWNGQYNSIPWYRAALRTWEPVPDDVPAVGAPIVEPTQEDYRGCPL